MKILLTGGSGFIGKNIIEKLVSKYDFLAPSRQELDLLDETAVIAYFKKEKPDLVIHSAGAGVAIGNGDQTSIFFRNAKMFFNIDRARTYFKRMIVFGTGAEYDKRKELIDVKEEDFDKSVPDDEYSFSKYVIAKYSENDDYVINLRLFGVFGPKEDYKRRFISNVICMALLDVPITIKQNARFDYLYINDLVNILKIFIETESPRFRVYNIGRGKKIDLLTLANLILKVTEKKLPIKILKEGFNNEYTCNVDRFKSEFPDVVCTDMEVAIREMVEYYQKELPNIDKNIFYNK